MPFDLQKYHGTAERGDVAGVALKAASAVLNTRMALEKLAAGNTDVSDEINRLNEDFRELHKMFDNLSGYTKE